MHAGVCLYFTCMESASGKPEAQSDSRVLSIEVVKRDGSVRTIPLASMRRPQRRPWTARLARCAGLPCKTPLCSPTPMSCPGGVCTYKHFLNIVHTQDF